eukprot:1075861-Pelagomonas_calceolata.AAC.1
MEPAQQGFHVHEEEEGGEGVSLDGPPLYGDVFCVLTSRQTDSGVCLLVQIFYSVNGIGRKAKVIHDPEQFIVVCCIEGRGKVGLLSRQKAQQKHLSAKSKKVYNSNTLITPPHIRLALHRWCMVSTE